MAEAIPAVTLMTDMAEPAPVAVAPVSPQNTTPFQVMLDTAVAGLKEVSATEEAAKAYVNQYAQGNVSMEEVMMEVSKMTMNVQLATTVVNHAVTTFKEIQQMAV
jgi:flagellar hook-basal body complex protein FliE